MNALEFVGLVLLALLVAFVAFYRPHVRARESEEADRREMERQRADAVARIAMFEDSEDTAPAVLSPPEFDTKRRA